ncbi:low affinity iron permease family protein [Azospirillum sp.]|uniref:low affinity iron permease family protein n=1 Tax=Azospirillum sp. TaxID=34012 RepID=UPI003D748CA2
MKEFFNKAALWTSRQAGRVSTFMVAVLVIIAWAVSGPMFHFSDTWQLVINTGTTIVTFLMVFLIQNTQNRDTQAIQIKLDELIRVTNEARNGLINLEDASEDKLQEVKEEFAKVKEEAIDERLEDVEEELDQSQEEIAHVKRGLEEVRRKAG